MPTTRFSASKVVFVIIAIVWAVIVMRAFLNVKGTDGLVPVVPQSEVETFAAEQLDALQSASFTGDQELCGFIYETNDQELGISRPETGDQASCNIAFFDEPGMVPIASIHTHGKHSDRYDGEVPSLIDLQSDIESGLDGYIATPGGRLWHIDHKRGIARLACGPGCLTQDPDYRECTADTIARSYTIDQLETRFNEGAAVC